MTTIHSSLASSSDDFLHVPENAFGTPHTQIVFFITGNPGLISYYHSFLSILSTSPPTSSCIIAGFSLGGFEIASTGDTSASFGIQDVQFPSNAPKGPFYGLEDQIKLTEARLESLVSHIDRDRDAPGDHDEQQGPRKPSVILIGHSVGAYIALELIRRHAVKKSLGGYGERIFNITGAILLTPTIVDIAKSSSGRVLTPLVTYIPRFPNLIAGAAKLLSWGLGEAGLRAFIGRVTGMSDETEGALDATVSFLRSDKGVKQALNMARDEMKMMEKDEWGEEIWGVAEESAGAMGDEGRSKLVFYFAKTDHWIADSTREELMKGRGRLDGEEWKPKMVVDEEDGLVHGWCIGQSPLVARKVGQWVEEILMEKESKGRR